MLLIPTLLVSMASAELSPSESKKKPSVVEKGKQQIVPNNSQDIFSQAPMVKVYITKQKKVIEVPLEHYVRNVIASEMPIDFHLEALKAQALVSRTYIANRLEKNLSDMKKYQNAHVTDTVQHQVFQTDEELQKRWGSAYPEKMEKLEQAVRETTGKILTYNGNPIYAAFFSTSNGRTENSEDYFSHPYPYLRSVDSSWDKFSPKYEKKMTITIQEMVNRLQKKTGKIVAVPAITTGKISILKRTEGQRINAIKIGDQTFSGREVRESLGLASSDFSWEIIGDRIVFHTYGYGHGVGMSQWGANLMAQEGKKTEEIIQHYYHGVKIETYQSKQSPN
jgi:stage II sporulation protein D